MEAQCSRKPQVAQFHFERGQSLAREVLCRNLWTPDCSGRFVADVFTKAKRSRVMAAIRSAGNKATELRLAGMLRRARIAGWRRHLPIVGRPDFAFRAERVAVFVDGCYWHGCARHHRLPGGNRAYWLRKLERNRSRDRLVTRTLRRQGWRVVRFWEHDLAKEARVLKRLGSILEERRSKIKPAFPASGARKPRASREGARRAPRSGNSGAEESAPRLVRPRPKSVGR